jgi:SAM-dependent methyltransferase
VAIWESVWKTPKELGMKVDLASKMSNAIALTRGPRLDYRTAEARTYTAWMDEHVQPYLRPGDLFLDVGCGSGKQTFKAESLGARAFGIDCSVEMIRYAKEVARESESGVQFLLADYASIPFEDHNFDLVLFPKNAIECSYVEASYLAQEIKRVLKPGGFLILTIRDALLHRAGNSAAVPESYDVLTGREAGTISVPGQGQFEYPSYFWTVAFAGFIFGQHLHLKESREISTHSYQLVFVSTEETGSTR